MCPKRESERGTWYPWTPSLSFKYTSVHAYTQHRRPKQGDLPLTPPPSNTPPPTFLSPFSLSSPLTCLSFVAYPIDAASTPLSPGCLRVQVFCICTSYLHACLEICRVPACALFIRRAPVSSTRRQRPPPPPSYTPWLHLTLGLKHPSFHRYTPAPFDILPAYSSSSSPSTTATTTRQPPHQANKAKSKARHINGVLSLSSCLSVSLSLLDCVCGA